MVAVEVALSFVLAFFCLRRKVMGKRVEEHSFSIEMKSEDCVRRISILGSENVQVFFEGFLGELKNVSMVEGVMLEVEGVNGVLRLDIAQGEMEKCLITKEVNEE
jgi:hypothetical protein